MLKTLSVIVALPVILSAGSAIAFTKATGTKTHIVGSVSSQFTFNLANVAPGGNRRVRANGYTNSAAQVTVNFYLQAGNNCNSTTITNTKKVMPAGNTWLIDSSNFTVGDKYCAIAIQNGISISRGPVTVA